MKKCFHIFICFLLFSVGCGSKDCIIEGIGIKGVDIEFYGETDKSMKDLDKYLPIFKIQLDEAVSCGRITSDSIYYGPLRLSEVIMPELLYCLKHPHPEKFEVVKARLMTLNTKIYIASRPLFIRERN